MEKNRLETPALLMNLDALDHNLAVMSEFSHRSKINIRPHFKNHTILSLASRQMKAGAIGITVARVHHAEALVEHGVKSILIANEIVDEQRIKRLIALSRRADVIVAVDNQKVIVEMARLARNAKSAFDVVVDLDIGLGRCGVSVAESLEVARAARANGLHVRGLMGYEGHLQRLDHTPETEKLRTDATGKLVTARRLFEQEGFPIEIVTTAGTGTCKFAAAFPAITEVQPGSYLLMETQYEPFVPEFRPGLTIVTTVVSKTSNSHLVLDAGMKAISAERGLPTIKDLPGLRLAALHAEHGIVQIAESSASINVGEKLELWVCYADATVHLHRQMYGVRGRTVEEVFRIES